MIKKPNFLVKFEESIDDTHYVSVSWGGNCWSGTPSMTNEELAILADKINEFLANTKH